MPEQLLSNAAFLGRRSTRQQEVERQAQTINVSARKGVVAIENLFGGQIIRGAEHCSRFVLFGQFNIAYCSLKKRASAQCRGPSAIPRALHNHAAGFDVAMDRPESLTWSVSAGSSAALSDVVSGPLLWLTISNPVASAALIMSRTET